MKYPDLNPKMDVPLKAYLIMADLPHHNLKALAAHIGHDFNHHNAQADAEAAGRVLLAMMRHIKAKTLSGLLQKAGMESK